ncbi:hypothetical protein HIM_00607 [Hirsutella minnesotensis 3608]|nr:hypothetical protein HIM_00607 [Hirsutella minnesotensis 3608]
MAAMRGPRSQVGSAAWITEERNFADQIAQAEVEEFSYSARNELDWLNEHMAGLFDENELNLAETFKTPGKLRGKTPRPLRNESALETRVPLSDVFGAKPKALPKISTPSRIQPPQVHADISSKSPRPLKLPSPTKQCAPIPAVQDSGYFGSQDVVPLDVHADKESRDNNGAALDNHQRSPAPVSSSKRFIGRSSSLDSPNVVAKPDGPETNIHTDNVVAVLSEHAAPDAAPGDTIEVEEAGPASPTSPSSDVGLDAENKGPAEEPQVSGVEQASDDVKSPSDDSSPIRPMVRKSSLNFASLPAREPLTAGKSIGARVSRTSHLDQIRTSYYSKDSTGKNVNGLPSNDQEEAVTDEMDVDEDSGQSKSSQSNLVTSHTKTYTQRLQDQINMLGKSQSNGPGQAKLASNLPPSQHTRPTAPKSLSPETKPTATPFTPGAFPDDDDDDDWIEPPATVTTAVDCRPALPKSHTADVMEGIQGKDTIGQNDFTDLNQNADGNVSGSPASDNFTSAEERFDCVSDLPMLTAQSTLDPELRSLKNAASASNHSLQSASGIDRPDSPSKSPSRAFRDSPLKQVKNKLSSILKSSKGLLASSAAVSAEGKSSIMSPSITRLGLYSTTSLESMASKAKSEADDVPGQAEQGDGSPSKPVSRRTRASSEREKEAKRRDKEARHMDEQNEKLEKAREKEREKALVFSQEQERIAAMERQIASKKTEDKPVVKETPKPTRSSPRKPKANDGEAKPTNDDADMEDALSNVPPPSASRLFQQGQSLRGQEAKRPLKPVKEIQAKAKQAPKVIRVNTGSQHSQYHPSSRPSTASHDTNGSSLQSQNRLVSKSSKVSLQAKSSTQTLRAPPSVTRPKAVDLAAKKKELDEREAQRRRDVKAEMERKRAAAQDDVRNQEQWRRHEVERQKQPDYERSISQHEAKTPAQRKAALEKAKQTKAPPPAARSQATGAVASIAGTVNQASTASNARVDSQASRPQPRMTSTLHRAQDESSRPVSSALSNSSKAGTKRALGPDRADEGHHKRALSRGGPTYQANEAKRRRTSDTFDDDAELDHSRNIKGPPVRPSAGFKKDVPSKPLYGYSNAAHGSTRDLFKATVTAQHHSQVKAAHPLDMAQISKGAIPFAPNGNSGTAYKTPARPGAYNGAKSAAKSATRSSPRFQNGESIELPEIQTDDDDDDDDDARGTNIAAWADSPDLRRALMMQETMDPSQIFGPPAPLNMEEVFNKSKDRWHKFRARTSSANWSGPDGLTEEDIRKDLAARDKLRREGGWSYDMSRDMI